MTQKVTPIAGVNTSIETEIRSKYPSVAANGIGQFLGDLLEAIPVRVWGVKISNVLFGLAVAPVAVLIYAWQKLMGERYALTNRSVQRWTIFNPKMVQSVSLSDIADIVVRQQSGQVFYRAADIFLMNAKGDPIMSLYGVPQADIFRQTILKARDAKVQTEQSLKTIQSRKG